MQYFITGSTGILGQKLIESLVNSGEKVIGLKRKSSQLSKLLQSISSEKIEWVDGDILDSFSYSSFLNSDTVVIHAAAMVSFQSSQEELMYKVNVDGTKILVDTCIEKNVFKFIHLSSIASVGRVKGLKLLNESAKWQDGPEHSTYAESKYLAELQVWRAFEEGLKGFVLNPSVILAQSDWSKSSSVIFKKMSKGSLFYPPGKINTVDVRDVVDTLLLLDKNNVNHERYICSGSFVSYENLLGLLAKAFNTKIPSVLVNSFWLRIIAFLSSGIKVFGKQPVLTVESIKAMESTNEFDSSKLIKELQFNFRPIEETVGWVVPYYVEKYKV